MALELRGVLNSNVSDEQKRAALEVYQVESHQLSVQELLQKNAVERAEVVARMEAQAESLPAAEQALQVKQIAVLESLQKLSSSKQPDDVKKRQVRALVDENRKLQAGASSATPEALQRSKVLTKFIESEGRTLRVAIDKTPSKQVIDAYSASKLAAQNAQLAKSKAAVTDSAR